MANSAEHKTLYHYGYRRSPDQDAPDVVRRPVVVVGAGPVGLAAAIDLAQRDVPVVLIDDADRIGEGSRGICWSKRTLEICDRLGVGEKLVAQGVTWKLGKLYHGDELVFSFDLLPEEGHKMPAFINLQQFYLEKALVDRADEIGNLDLRWKNKLTGLEQRNDHVRLTIDTPDGPYTLDADWLIAADGARSTTRDLLGLDVFRRHLRGQVPHRRYQDGRRLADRAPLLVRPVVPFRPVGADAPAARQCLAHRFAARARRRRRRRAGAGARARAHRAHRRRPPVRARMGVDLPLQLPPARALRARPRGVRRRRRAPGVAVRRARRQFRHPGCGESGLEARRRAEGRGGCRR